MQIISIAEAHREWRRTLDLLDLGTSSYPTMISDNTESFRYSNHHVVGVNAVNWIAADLCGTQRYNLDKLESPPAETLRSSYLSNPDHAEFFIETCD